MTQAEYKTPEGWHVVSGSEVARRQRDAQMRAELHASINALTRQEVEHIIRRVHPRMMATRIGRAGEESCRRSAQDGFATALAFSLYFQDVFRFTFSERQKKSAVGNEQTGPNPVGSLAQETEIVR